MPKFEQTSCSQCGCDLGPGDSGVSHCADHAPKHTPGPWILTTTAKYAYINAKRINGDRTFILQRAREHYNPKKLAQIDADCRLIAAAPELLEALLRLMPRPFTGEPTHAELVSFWEREKSLGRGEADDVLFALAAIAKATGEAA